MKKAIWINVLIGLWLIVAPFALPTGTLTGAWFANDMFLGLLLLVASAWILGSTLPRVGAEWFEIICGLWLILAPFMFGYRALTLAMWNDVICGVAAACVATAVYAGWRAPRTV